MPLRVCAPRLLIYPYIHPRLTRALNLPSSLHSLSLDLKMHATATVDGTVIAETDQYQFVEGNVYFPPDSIKNPSTTLTGTDHTTGCPWKGEAHYYDIHVNDKVLGNAAWYYPQPLEKATHIKDHVAFCQSYLLAVNDLKEEH